MQEYVSGEQSGMPHSLRPQTAIGAATPRPHGLHDEVCYFVVSIVHTDNAWTPAQTLDFTNLASSKHLSLKSDQQGRHLFCHSQF